MDAGIWNVYGQEVAKNRVQGTGVWLGRPPIEADRVSGPAASVRLGLLLSAGYSMISSTVRFFSLEETALRMVRMA